MDLEGAPIDPAISSRAGEEIDEDEEIQRLVNEANEAKLLPPTIQWSVPTETPIKTSLFVIGFSGAATVFLNAYFGLEQKDCKIATIQLPEVVESIKKRRGGSKPSKYNDDSCYLYKVNDTVIALVNHSIPLDRSNEWSSFLYKLIAAERTILLDVIQRADLTTDEDNPSPSLPLLLSLQTDAFVKSNSNLPKERKSRPLESPNWITGVPAALLVKHQIYNKQMIALLSLKENSRWIDIETVQAFEGEFDLLNESLGLSLGASTTPSTGRLPLYQSILKEVNKSYGDAIYI